jgi:hypothetical protein
VVVVPGEVMLDKHAVVRSHLRCSAGLPDSYNPKARIGKPQVSTAKQCCSHTDFCIPWQQYFIDTLIPGRVELRPMPPQVSFVDDIAMLHGMGIRLILVLGAVPQINQFVRLRGKEPQFASGYRITDELSMEAAMEAAGSNRVLFEALLSKVLPPFFPLPTLCLRGLM